MGNNRILELTMIVLDNFYCYNDCEDMKRWNNLALCMSFIISHK